MDGINMKFIENLNKKAENTQTNEEFKGHTGDAAKRAGMILDDNDIEQISGGRETSFTPYRFNDRLM